MKNKLLLVLTLLLSVSMGWAQPDFSMVGYATADGGTTGGKGGKVVCPQTIQELANYCSASEPYIILINKEFEYTRNEYVNSNNEIVASEAADGALTEVNGYVLKMASNKTLLGVDNKAFFNRVAISIQCQSNIIIRNIKFTMKDVLISHIGENKIRGYRFDPDCISIQADSETIPEAQRISQHIWIDHCEFYNEDPNVMTDKDRYDGLVDTKNNSINITISWCYFHDHHKACLIGKGGSDKYDHKTTFHHNYYKNISARLPLFRYGTGHIFNNLMEEGENGINARVDADLYVEKNYFLRNKKPVFGKPSENGKVTLVDNCFMSCTRVPAIIGKNADGGKCSVLSSGEEFEPGVFIPSYDYSLVVIPVDQVPVIIPAYSGVGKIENEYQIPTNISQELVMPELIATEYYNLSGMKIKSQTKGINIVRKVYDDGTVEIEKTLIK